MSIDQSEPGLTLPIATQQQKNIFVQQQKEQKHKKTLQLLLKAKNTKKTLLNNLKFVEIRKAWLKNGGLIDQNWRWWRVVNFEFLLYRGPGPRLGQSIGAAALAQLLALLAWAPGDGD